MGDLDPFNALEIVALTAVGESESQGEEGMTETICTLVNRAKANKKWLGGSDLRAICLQPAQYQCWQFERDRLIQIGLDTPLYGPYVAAVRIAGSAIAGTLVDITNNAVSYYDSASCAEPYWAKGKTPCHVRGERYFYDLEAITLKVVL